MGGFYGLTGLFDEDISGGVATAVVAVPGHVITGTDPLTLVQGRFPYTHTTFLTLKEQLASRLQDTSKVKWVDAELGIYLNEALRTFAVLSGLWRERVTFATEAGVTYYHLQTKAPNLFGFSITDRDLITQIQYHFLEPATGSSWTGTDQFTLDEVARAIERRRNQFLAETGIVLTQETINWSPSPIGRMELSDNVIDVRRLVWRNSRSYYTHLWREDEMSLQFNDALWSVNLSSTPDSYSILATNPIQVQLSPRPSDTGRLDIITVKAGSTLTPSTAATSLGVPDDLYWIVKWGAMADLLGKDGPAADPLRSAFCANRYRQGVELARMLSSVVSAEINGKPTYLDSLAELDAAEVNWNNKSGTPVDIALVGYNLIAVRPVPDNVYSITLDLVRRMPVLVLNGDYVQVGRELLEPILGYAEHLAMFKSGYYELESTARQAEDFLLQALTYNQRLGAAAKYIIRPREQSRREQYHRPRRQLVDALGAATGDE